MLPYDLLEDHTSHFTMLPPTSCYVPNYPIYDASWRTCIDKNKFILPGLDIEIINLYFRA